jgi:hypothetical protein
VAIALDPAQPAAVRVVACREVLDRGHGRPRQAVELTGGEAGPVRIEVPQVGGSVVPSRHIGES